MKKTQPLSDLTNSFNLIPLSTLRKLCESTNPKTNYAASSLLKSPNSRNILSGAFPAKRGSDDIALAAANSSGSTKSDNTSSIGSSGFNHNATPPADVFTTPSLRVAPPPTPPLGNRGSQVVYNQRPSDIEAKRAREVLSVPLSSCTLERMNGKGKPITMPASHPTTLGKTSNKSKENALPFMPSASSPLQKAMDKGKAIVEPSSCSVPEKSIKEKGKAIVVPSDGPSLEKRNDRQKAMLFPLSCPPGETEDKRKSVAKPSSSLPSNETEQKKKKELALFSCPPLPRTKNKCKRDKNAEEVEHSRSWTDPHQKRRKRRCTRQEADPEFALPREFVEQQRAYFKEIDEFELVEEEISGDELDT